MAEKKSTNARNPLEAGDPQSTIENCRDVLDWMASVTDDEGGCDQGRAMVLRTIHEALGSAQAQLEAKARPRVEVVHG
jgi:hypothetical protein